MLFWPSYEIKIFYGRYNGHISNLWTKIHENDDENSVRCKTVTKIN